MALFRLRRSARRRPVVWASVLWTMAIGLGLTGSTIASAQQGQTKPVDPSRRPNPYASPLDTILSTRLWADVPPAQDFVKETRPDPKSLDYTPLTGQQPDRPKPRDADGVAALQAELESSRAANEAKAKDVQVFSAPRAPKAPARHARKAAKKPKTAAD